jgi:glutathione S-transferase
LRRDNALWDIDASDNPGQTTAMSLPELYSYAACPFAQRTRMVLAEKDIDFELHEVDLANRPANWREISPTGKVPLLRHEGETIYESTIINQYLDEAFPGHPLMPATPLGRARARIWMDHCDQRFLPAMHALMRHRDDPDQLPAAMDKASDALRELEHRGLDRSGDGPYWFGSEPSLIDFQYLPFFERFPVYEALCGLGWPAECIRLRRWFDAMCARDSVRPTLRPAAAHIENQRRLNERFAAMRQSA